MKKEDIIKAWATIREENNTIPNEVLDFMKNAALRSIELKEERERYDKAIQYLYECEERSTQMLIDSTKKFGQTSKDNP